MPTKEEWSRAFAKQAQADFAAWNALQLYLQLPEGSPPLPRSQKLHFLQMACEKLVKAHLLKGGSRLEDLAREIELLSPAVRAGGRRQDNCEYPWERGGELYIPAEWPFSNLDLLTAREGRNILKRIRGAINRLAS